MIQHIHEQIKAVCAKAEARAYRTAKRKLVAEQKRHDMRLAEIDSELQGELEVARAALALIPKEGEADQAADLRDLATFGAPLRETPMPEEDEPDMVAIPPALMQEPPPLPRGAMLETEVRDKPTRRASK